MEYDKNVKDTQVDTNSTPSESADAVITEFPPSTGHIYGSVEPHVFSHPARAEYWRNVYDNAKYECRHRFDPSFQWSPLGEVTVKRKVITKTLRSSLHTRHGILWGDAPTGYPLDDSEFVPIRDYPLS
jgi:hypothetical protein